MKLIDILKNNTKQALGLATEPDMVLYEFELLQGRAALCHLVPNPTFQDYFALLIEVLQPEMDAHVDNLGINRDEAVRIRDQNIRLLNVIKAERAD